MRRSNSKQKLRAVPALCTIDPRRVEAVRRRDKRKNIPAEELGDFVGDEGFKI